MMLISTQREKYQIYFKDKLLQTSVCFCLLVHSVVWDRDRLEKNTCCHFDICGALTHKIWPISYIFRYVWIIFSIFRSQKVNSYSLCLQILLKAFVRVTDMKYFVFLFTKSNFGFFCVICFQWKRGSDTTTCQAKTDVGTRYFQEYISLVYECTVNLNLVCICGNVESLSRSADLLQIGQKSVVEEVFRCCT